MTPVAHSHCSYCGTAYPDAAGWPRACPACGQQVWRNPLPVAVAIQPVLTTTGTGVVVVRRDIEPARGKLALPGGFIEYGEDWRDALVRELSEETGLTATASTVRLFDVYSAPRSGTVLIFGVLPVRPAAELPRSAPTAEATEWLVLTEPADLAFDTHTQVLADFLNQHR
jgi:ADP-ribose pyrophosphatase YjhB (NUDIX family)